MVTQLRKAGGGGGEEEVGGRVWDQTGSGLVGRRRERTRGRWNRGRLLTGRMAEGRRELGRSNLSGVSVAARVEPTRRSPAAHQCSSTTLPGSTPSNPNSKACPSPSDGGGDGRREGGRRKKEEGGGGWNELVEEQGRKKLGEGRGSRTRGKRMKDYLPTQNPPKPVLGLHERNAPQPREKRKEKRDKCPPLQKRA